MVPELNKEHSFTHLKNYKNSDNTTSGETYTLAMR